MIVSSLCEYYKINEDIFPAVGYSKRKIDYLVLLTLDGQIDDVIYLGEECVGSNNKKIIKLPKLILPFRTEKTCKDANIIEHRAKYLFGFKDFKNGEFVVDKSYFEFFKCVTIEFFKDIQSSLSQAYYNFARKWVPEENTRNPYLLKLGVNCFTGNFAFALSGRPDLYLNDDIAVREKWDKSFAYKLAEENNVIAQCAILGKELPVARIHYKIRRIKGGHSSGCTFVCFNSEAEESYGKKKSYNSSISYIAMREYTEAFNYLLEDTDDKQLSHKTLLGDMTVVHFALAKDEDAYLQYVNNDIFFEFTDEPSVEDIEKEVDDSFKLISKGKVSTFDIEKSDLVEYCIFGVVPNNSRLSERFFYRNTFGALKRNVERYNEDFSIEKRKKAPPINLILKELVLPNADDHVNSKSNKKSKIKNQKLNIPPDLSKALLTAMLQGTPFPQKLLQTAVRRIKTDVYINDTRAGLVKACLNRNIKNDKEKIKMSLDTQNKTSAYLCGRLFAVLEKIQKDSVGKEKELNKTIKNTYFSSACTTPAAVFPKIIMLSIVHQEKLSDTAKIFYDNLCEDIISNIEGEFPKTLSLEEQGSFIIGYYHQKEWLYTKKENKTEEN